LKINHQRVSYTQRDMLHFRPEARGKSLDLVIAGLEISYVVLAESIRPNDPAASKLWLSNSQTHLRHDRAGCIVNYPSDGSPRSLRREIVLDEQYKNNEAREKAQR
jgi:hypothetical protein